ncbi:MAG: metallophosphoesterase [Kaiparowitsia implicata GSE-PSE-MK54-09C]|jgi:3',5'-cyclic AMP phosphodiesterase CpdA|nr:metallophosphoesterase [Kaiparowitsia implicata GSE-PSE-MK54-09C]
MSSKLTNEPSIATKIRTMRQRVRWQHPQIMQRNIDQTRLSIEGGDGIEEFSFLVLGDSGTSRHRRSNPQRQVAEQLLAHLNLTQFTIHTGDVVYLVGSKEQYPSNFIRPYREWIVGGENYKRIPYNDMTFKHPILPVPGNHDYYDLPTIVGLISGLTGPIRYALQSVLDFDIGWHGSHKGDAYARAFLDYLKALPEAQLAQHLDRHYTSQIDGKRCLTYRPGEFTRLPNRYYTFRYGGIDFFALDSNSFAQPLALDATEAGAKSRKDLEQQLQQLEATKADLTRKASLGSLNPLPEDEVAEEIAGEIESINEQLADIDKQLAARGDSEVDVDQLNWLRDGLIASWQNPDVRGRIVFFHHPPYVTEASKWPQGQTLAVRHNLRQVLDAVLDQVGDIAQGQPLVNLVLNGHAHCLEHLQTGDTGHGDANISWVICGGSGYSLRRQRQKGPNLEETIGGKTRTVATSHLFLGRDGKGDSLKRPYSGLRIDVRGGTPVALDVTPLVAEKYDGTWQGYAMEPFTV